MHLKLIQYLQKFSYSIYLKVEHFVVFITLNLFLRTKTFCIKNNSNEVLGFSKSNPIGYFTDAPIIIKELITFKFSVVFQNYNKI
jgi:hypothetical protein